MQAPAPAASLVLNSSPPSPYPVPQQQPPRHAPPPLQGSQQQPFLSSGGLPLPADEEGPGRGAECGKGRRRRPGRRAVSFLRPVAGSHLRAGALRVSVVLFGERAYMNEHVHFPRVSGGRAGLPGMRASPGTSQVLIIIIIIEGLSHSCRAYLRPRQTNKLKHRREGGAGLESC